MSYQHKKFSKRIIKDFNKPKTEDCPKVIDSQKQLLFLLAKGNTLEEIATMLNCTKDNIKKRTYKLYKKFEVNSRTALIQKAINFKLLKYKDISYRFRKRFFKTNDDFTLINIDEPVIESLKTEEVNVLKLASLGLTKKEIIKILSFRNMHYCNYVYYEIFKKLKTTNITNSVFKAIKLGILSI